MLEGEHALGKRPDMVEDMAKVALPRRTLKKPSGEIGRAFVFEVTRLRWPTYRGAIIDWLAISPDPPMIELLHFDDKSLNEEFTLAKSDIRSRLQIKRPKDVRLPFRYFALGTLVGEGVSGDSILTITRRELLQLYVLTYACKYIVWKMQILPAEETHDGVRRLFENIDRLMVARKSNRHGHGTAGHY